MPCTLPENCPVERAHENAYPEYLRVVIASYSDNDPSLLPISTSYRMIQSSFVSRPFGPQLHTFLPPRCFCFDREGAPNF